MAGEEKSRAPSGGLLGPMHRQGGPAHTSSWGVGLGMGGEAVFLGDLVFGDGAVHCRV